jgi:NAD(P)-dependent dehydrogenase (short-subunit alcohol dehydrogenase family)
MKAYGQSKLAEMLFAVELDRRSRSAGWGIVSNTAHPGLTLTNLQTSGWKIGRDKPSVRTAAFRRASKLQVITSLGETLLQTPPAVALLGDETAYTGPDRSMFYRWFTRPDTRRIYPGEDHDVHSRAFTALERPQDIGRAATRNASEPPSWACLRCTARCFSTLTKTKLC